MEHGRPEIDYSLIARGIEFYKNKGFQYIEVPWIAPEEYNKITYPGPFPFSTQHGVLVGSAEQALIFMADCGKLKKGQMYMAASPCFRAEQVDILHQQSFFKVELFCFGADVSGTLLLAAAEFFKSIDCDTEIVPSKEHQVDLNCKNIELGSYGWHQYKDLLWSYGTGIAEPRTSLVMKRSATIPPHQV